MSHAESQAAAIPSSAKLLRSLAISLTAALIALVVLWYGSHQWTPARIALGLGLTIPLWAPLRGLVRGDRRTYAWATLCVVPYFILGITETIASPLNRGWSGACLALALTLFATLIGYLRVTRPALPVVSGEL